MTERTVSMQLSLFGGTFLKLDKNGVPLVDEKDQGTKPMLRLKSRWVAEVADQGGGRQAYGGGGRAKSR